jgi:uncharacterized RDD family membrane protein YckC
VHAPDAIDLNAFVTTPENVRFEYRIAGPFRRLPALILDFAVRGILFWILLILMALLGFVVRFSGGIAVLLFLISWFALDWFYGLLFETFWNGQTPGKWLTKVRVISVDGRPINAYQATIRNFLRLADFAPMVSLELFSPDAPPMYVIPTFLVSLLCMTITKRFQRLGDLAAGTMVVVTQRSWVPPHIKFDDPRVESLSGHIPANFRMTTTLAKAIALFVERRARIPNVRRQELAAYIAAPLLRKFNFRDDTSPDLLLCSLYYREFIAKDAFIDSQSMASPPPSAQEHRSPISDSKASRATISALPVAAPSIATRPTTTPPIAVPPPVMDPTPPSASDSVPPGKVPP